MKCIAVALPTPPTLPFPLTLGLPIPSPAFAADLCCKILPFTTLPIPPLPPLILNPAAVAIIMQALAAIEAYFDALAFECPKEAQQ